MILFPWEQTVSMRLKWLWLLWKKNESSNLKKILRWKAENFFIDRFILMNMQSYMCTVGIFSSSANTSINMLVIQLTQLMVLKNYQGLGKSVTENWEMCDAICDKKQGIMR